MEYNINIEDSKLSPKADSIIIPVTKSRYDTDYERYRVDSLRKLSEFYTHKKLEIDDPVNFGLGTLASALGSFIIFIGSKSNQKGVKYFFISIGGASLLGGLMSMKSGVSKIETKVYTGKTRNDFIKTSYQETETGRNFLFKDKPASNLNFEIKSNNDFFYSIEKDKTDSNGYALVKVKDSKIKFHDGKFIIPGNYSNEIFGQIKPIARQNILKRIHDNSELRSLDEVIIKTIGESKDDMEVLNDSCEIPAYTEKLKEGGFTESLNGFIEDEINSKTKEASFSIKDKNSRRIIPNVMIDVKKSPTLNEILSPYFYEGKIFDFAAKKIKYLKDKHSEYADNKGNIFIKVYPASYLLELTHPEYHFRELPIDFSKKDNLKKEIYLDGLDKGTRKKENTKE